MRKPHVVVIGGGYAGVLAAREARTFGADVTLLDATGTHDLLPRLATVAAGVGPSDDAFIPLPAMLPRVHLLQGRVDQIDHALRSITYTAPSGDERTLAYDALVVTVGAVGAPPPIPGLADHAWTVRSAEEALRLRQRVAGTERLVIIGAGATGVQLAGEVAAERPRVAITLVEMTDRILPSLPAGMAERAGDVLTGRGVEVRTGIAVTEIAAHGAHFDDGSDAAGLVVWAGGFETTGSALLPKADTTDGRVVVDRCTQVADHGPVFAAGDVAAHRGPGGRLLPQTAQVAVRAGKLAGANAVRLAEGRRPRPSTLRHIGWVVPLGGGQAVAKVGPLSLTDRVTGRLAPLLHDVIDLRHLYQAGGIPTAVNHHQAW